MLKIAYPRIGRENGITQIYHLSLFFQQRLFEQKSLLNRPLNRL